MNEKNSAPPATIAGLRAQPCDPLILAVRLDGKPMSGAASSSRSTRGSGRGA